MTKRRTYTKAFKQETVRLAEQQGYAQTGRDLGVNRTSFWETFRGRPRPLPSFFSAPPASRRTSSKSRDAIRPSSLKAASISGTRLSSSTPPTRAST